MNFGGTSSGSEARSRVGLRGTAYEDEAANQAVGQGRHLSSLTNRFMESPQAMYQFGRSMLPEGKYGVGQYADRAVEQMTDYALNKSSADYGSRGFVSPENRGAIAGSAMQNVMPQLIPYMQQAQMAQFMAPQNLIQSAKTSADYWSRALGAQSDASSSSFGFNFGVLSNSGSGDD